MYVLDLHILNQHQLYRAVSRKLGVTICRSQPPRDEDLAEWGAQRLQPDKPPATDVSAPTDIAEQREDGLMYRKYSQRAFSPAERQRYQAKATIQVNEHFERLVRAQAAEYPESETKTWPQQEAEARALSVDPAAATPCIDVLLMSRFGEAPTNEQRTAFAARVVSKADAYRNLALEYAGKRQAHVGRIWLASTRMDIDAAVTAALAEA